MPKIGFLKLAPVLGALTLLLSMFFSPPASAQIGDAFGLSPFWDWRTIETEHFRVTFPANLEAVATKSANNLEEAHLFLSKELRWEPAFKTQVVVVDNSDVANGLTSPTGRLGMVFQVTPPESWFSTAYYDDWLRLLAIHEYTHFLNMDTTHSFWSVLRVIFGDVTLPNSFWPTWMLEGLAVYMETRFTRSGRGRSTYYEMILRTAVEESSLDSSRFITLDKINGSNPYFPGGETPYLFGYQLMNQVAQGSGGGENLGALSETSGARIPYFINGNLENVTGKDWYSHWNEWVGQTRARLLKDLAQLKLRPLTPFERLTPRSYSTLGNASSPDGKWLAYSEESLDYRSSLYLKNLETGQIHVTGDKIFGVGMAFTPDSRFLVESELHQSGLYELWSDLSVYDLRTEKHYWISDSLRARDPDVSKDGKSVVFTVTDAVTTGLATAPLIYEGTVSGRRLKLGPVTRLYMPPSNGRVSNPKLSPDGRRVVFSLHLNGKPGEDLMEWADGKIRTLASDGNFHHFPAFDPEGKLYFVSDQTGVDNLYQLSDEPSAKPRQMTHVITGLWLPSFGPKGLYASIYGLGGWDLAKVELSPQPGLTSDTVHVSSPSAPTPDSNSQAFRKEESYPVRNYSIYPSILPRQWLPYAFYTSPKSIYFGGQILGFDALDYHSYSLGLAYDTQIKKPDSFLNYSNRSLGVTLSFFYSTHTADTQLDSDLNLQAYLRRTEFSVMASYPFRWTHSSLTPVLALGATRDFLFGTDPSTPVGSGIYVPRLDARLYYADTESSRLAVTAEVGRSSQLSTRTYLNSGSMTVKGVFSDAEHFKMTEHSVLIPAIKASMTSKTSGTYGSSNVLVGGGFNHSSPDLLSTLPIRGYNGQTYYTRAASVFSLDYRFPVLRIFRGWGTNPLFFDQVYGFVFGEAAALASGEPAASVVLPSAGGGIRMVSELLIHIPLVLSVEFQRGFNLDQGGRGQVFFGVNLPVLQF